MNNEVKSKDLIIENHVNQIHLTNFRKKDMDLFLVICDAFKDTNEYSVKINYDDIKKIACYRDMSLDTFHQNLKNLDAKEIFTSLKITVETENEYCSARFITTFRANKQKKLLTVTINPDFVKLFNIFEQYTKIDLAIHTSLQSKYSAILYRMLCQFNKNKWWKVTIEDFREIFDAPEKYDARKIMQKIIEPSIEELKPYMNIDCEVIRAERKRGKPVLGYQFNYSLKHTDKKENIPGQIEFENTNEFDEIVLDMQGSKQCSSVDEVIDLIDSYNLGIGSRSTFSIAQKSVELNRDNAYIKDCIEIAQGQNCDNLGAKIMYLVINGYDKRQKSYKKTGFNNFESRKYDFDELEKKLLGWN